jgi:hypothetical protein
MLMKGPAIFGTGGVGDSAECRVPAAARVVNEAMRKLLRE